MDKKNVFFAFLLNFFQKKLVYVKNNLFLCVKCLTPNIKRIMNKVELISAIAEKAGMTKVDARKAVDAFMGVTKNELKKGGKVALVGFGTLSVSQRPARQGRNPRTGKTIKIAAKKVAKFKAASNLLK